MEKLKTASIAAFGQDGYSVCSCDSRVADEHGPNSTICWISIICPKHNCAVNYQATSLNPSFQLTISVTQNLNYHHHPHHRQCMDRQGSSMLHLALARFYDESCHFLLCNAPCQKYNLNLKHKLHMHRVSPTNLELSPSHVALYSRRLTEAFECSLKPLQAT